MVDIRPWHPKHPDIFQFGGKQFFGKGFSSELLKLAKIINTIWTRNYVEEAVLKYSHNPLIFGAGEITMGHLSLTICLRNCDRTPRESFVCILWAELSDLISVCNHDISFTLKLLYFNVLNFSKEDGS